MSISIYRLILITASMLLIVDRAIRFLKKEESQSFFKLFSTLIIWLPILVISANPNAAYSITNKLGLGQNLNPLIFISFILVFALLFKLLSLIENLERNITKIVREQALKEILSLEQKLNNLSRTLMILATKFLKEKKPR